MLNGNIIRAPMVSPETEKTNDELLEMLVKMLRKAVSTNPQAHSTSDAMGFVALVEILKELRGLRADIAALMPAAAAPTHGVFHG